MTQVKELTLAEVELVSGAQTFAEFSVDLWNAVMPGIFEIVPSSPNNWAR